MSLPVEDLFAILPFIIAVCGGLAVILMDIFTAPETERAYLGGLSLVFLVVMAGAAAVSFGAPARVAFFGTVMADDLSRCLTILLAVATALAVLIAMGRLPETGAMRGELYALMLFATGGASLLVQAIDMVTLFIALETLSIPAYILAAALRSDQRSTEAGFKYFILGAFASGFLVYGIALLYGASGGTSFKVIAALSTHGWTSNPLLAVGALMVLTGILFKIGAVPFHMWVPDVYQGAPTTVTAFFATAVKAAAFTALIRLLMTAFPGMRQAGAIDTVGWYPLVVGVAILTMTAANLTALVQTDVKRILAFSSIAHAGYLFIGLLTGQAGVTAILFYLTAYTFMTAGAFALVAYFEKQGGGTSPAEYRGLGKRSPKAAVALSVFLFSLAGIPPTAGFFAKFYLFKVAIDHQLAWLVVVAVVNSAISAFYYLRITVSMYMEEPEEAAASPIVPSMAIAVAVALCLLFVLAMGLFPTPYLEAAKAAAAVLF